MTKLLDYLFSGSTRFFLEKTAFSNYAILFQIANGNSEWKDKANSILVRANLKEPMNLDAEADKLYMEIIYAVIKQR